METLELFFIANYMLVISGAIVIPLTIYLYRLNARLNAQTELIEAREPIQRKIWHIIENYSYEMDIDRQEVVKEQDMENNLVIVVGGRRITHYSELTDKDLNTFRIRR